VLRECVHCEIEFDLDCTAKKRVGGKINECPDCVEELQSEVTVKYLGLPAGDGKANALSIVAFESNADRNAYATAWKATTGFHKGKEIGNRPMPHATYAGGNGNHKGKL